MSDIIYNKDFFNDADQRKEEAEKLFSEALFSIRRDLPGRHGVRQFDVSNVVIAKMKAAEMLLSWEFMNQNHTSKNTGGMIKDPESGRAPVDDI